MAIELVGYQGIKGHRILHAMETQSRCTKQHGQSESGDVLGTSPYCPQVEWTPRSGQVVSPGGLGEDGVV